MARSTKPSSIIIIGCPPVGKSGLSQMGKHILLEGYPLGHAPSRRSSKIWSWAPTEPAPGHRAGTRPRARADLDREVDVFDGLLNHS